MWWYALIYPARIYNWNEEEDLRRDPSKYTVYSYQYGKLYAYN